MNNFKEKYVDLTTRMFNMVYYDINDFILEHRDKQFDWSKLSFEVFDYAGDRKKYKFGPDMKWNIPEMDSWYNKDRAVIETLEFIIDDSEHGFDHWDGIVVNGKQLPLLDEKAKVEIADYMEKQLLKN